MVVRFGNGGDIIWSWIIFEYSIGDIILGKWSLGRNINNLKWKYSFSGRNGRD